MKLPLVSGRLLNFIGARCSKRWLMMTTLATEYAKLIRSFIIANQMYRQ